MAHRTLL